MDLFVYQIEFDKTRLSCPGNSDQTVHTTLSGASWGGGLGVVGVQGMKEVGVGGGLKSKVKSLKIDIAERTRNCES